MGDLVNSFAENVTKTSGSTGSVVHRMMGPTSRHALALWGKYPNSFPGSKPSNNLECQRETANLWALLCHLNSG